MQRRRKQIRFTVPGNRKPTPVRCRRKIKGIECGHRQTLSKQPAEYIRPPKCKCCKKPFTYIDFYRIKKEWSAKNCKCLGYPFPHAKGRGYCEHNSKLTTEDLRLRAEGGGPLDATDGTEAPF